MGMVRITFKDVPHLRALRDRASAGVEVALYEGEEMGFVNRADIERNELLDTYLRAIIRRSDKAKG